MPVWFRWPEEIEDDLLAYRNLDIGLWHRLSINPDTGGPFLSSRRLQVVLEGLPAKSRFKTALRGGRQSRGERVVEELFNELARFRSSFHAANTEEGKGAYDPPVFRDPVDEIEHARQEAEDAEAAASAQERFESAIGFS